MSTRPRVHAEAEIESETLQDGLGRTIFSPPSVEVRVDFDLHDHERALTYLERAVADVRSQIEETR